MRQIPALPPYSAWERELKFTSMRESILKRPVLRKASRATLKVQQTSLSSGHWMVRLKEASLAMVRSFHGTRVTVLAFSP